MILVVVGALPYERCREHALLEAYARDSLVIYTEPDPRCSFRSGGARHATMASGGYPGTGIFTLPLVAPIPGNRFSSIARVSRWWALRRLLRDLRKRTTRRVALVLQYPRLLPTLRGLPAGLKVYEVVDDYVALMTSPGGARAMAIAHARTIRESDLVVTTSTTLHQQVVSMHADAVESSNGVEFEEFSRQPAPRASGALESIPRPRIGLVGNLNDRIDWQLIDQLCQERPDWQLVFVGPVYGAQAATTDALATLSARRNFHLLPAVPRDELAGTIAALDVCLIPYRLTRATRAINPLKLYQYLAAGKPVVASPLPQLARFADVVTSCRTPAAFASGIADALRTGGDARILQLRQDRARDYDWAAIADRRLSALRKRLHA